MAAEWPTSGCGMPPSVRGSIPSPSGVAEKQSPFQQSCLLWQLEGRPSERSLAVHWLWQQPGCSLAVAAWLCTGCGSSMAPERAKQSCLHALDRACDR